MKSLSSQSGFLDAKAAWARSLRRRLVFAENPRAPTKWGAARAADMGFVGVLRVVRSSCRWAIYFGKKKKGRCIFTDPDHGLVEQSYLPPFLPGMSLLESTTVTMGSIEMAGALPRMTMVGET